MVKEEWFKSGPMFRAECICGNKSWWTKTAGIAHGAEADHADKCLWAQLDRELDGRTLHPSRWTP